MSGIVPFNQTLRFVTWRADNIRPYGGVYDIIQFTIDLPQQEKAMEPVSGSMAFSLQGLIFSPLYSAALLVAVGVVLILILIPAAAVLLVAFLILVLILVIHVVILLNLVAVFPQR